MEEAILFVISFPKRETLVILLRSFLPIVFLGVSNHLI